MRSIEKIKLTECPRDAMQGINYIISTDDKIKYLNLLLKVGFDTLDFGSFVSPKAIPQMADTAKVLDSLDLSGSATKLLAIVANLKGVDKAVKYQQITYLGYPFSISETFQKRNTNSDIKSSLSTIEELLNQCAKSNKTAVVYLSMAFGNPYGDHWSEDLVSYWTNELVKRGVSIIALSDTIAGATPTIITSIFKSVSLAYPTVTFGVHLHSNPDNWEKKIDAAYQSGCRKFDSAIKGYGGCPMALDKLTGNIATENLLSFLSKENEDLGLNMSAFEEAMHFSARVFH